MVEAAKKDAKIVEAAVQKKYDALKDQAEKDIKEGFDDGENAAKNMILNGYRHTTEGLTNDVENFGKSIVSIF